MNMIGIFLFASVRFSSCQISWVVSDAFTCLSSLTFDSSKISAQNIVHLHMGVSAISAISGFLVHGNTLSFYTLFAIGLHRVVGGDFVIIAWRISTYQLVDRMHKVFRLFSLFGVDGVRCNPIFRRSHQHDWRRVLSLPCTYRNIRIVRIRLRNDRREQTKPKVKTKEGL